jgi:hypothetical protein
MNAHKGTIGKITYIRVSPHGGYGAPQDHLNTQVVIKLDTKPDMAFGFELTAGSPDLPTNLAMLSILRDAYIHKFTISIGYWIEELKNTGVIDVIDLADQ